MKYRAFSPSQRLFKGSLGVVGTFINQPVCSRQPSYCLPNSTSPPGLSSRVIKVSCTKSWCLLARAINHSKEFLPTHQIFMNPATACTAAAARAVVVMTIIIAPLQRSPPLVIGIPLKVPLQITVTGFFDGRQRGFGSILHSMADHQVT